MLPMSAENDYADFPPLVMTFAASDPSGGSGMQADVLTLASMGCHPLTIVTALTVQDTAGVEEIHPVDDECVADQARALLLRAGPACATICADDATCPASRGSGASRANRSGDVAARS